MYVCMYVRTYVCMYVCVCIMYVCMYVYMYICMYVYTYVCMYVCTHFILCFLAQSVEVSGGRLLSDDGLDLTGAYLLETLGSAKHSLHY